MIIFPFYTYHAQIAQINNQRERYIYVCVLGWFITYIVLSKVQKMFVPGYFPIHMDPRTSPSEKNLKKIDTSYWSKQAEVLLYDVVYSDFSPIT